MFKKVLVTTALFGASTLGVAVANAAAPGVYITGQLGYAQTHMDNMTDLDKIYSASKSPIHIEPIPDSKDKNLTNNGLAGRVAIGYQFNQNFAVELGYLRLNSKKVKVLKKTTNPPPHDLDFASMQLAQHALDFSAKGILPLCNNFNVYGKLGVAYLTSDVSVNGENEEKNPISYDVNDVMDIKKHQWAPEVAVGVSYQITQNVALDTSWTHIQTIGKHRAGNVDFFAAGISYNFG